MIFSTTFIPAAATVALLASTPVVAWGTLGHSTIGTIAQHYLEPRTQKWVDGLLNDTLANVANWADSYRRTPEGNFSAPFHYVDAEDDPVHECNVNLKRDCGPDGCILSAITNYTERVMNHKLPQADRAEALKFLTHFLGDITQPLHAEAKNIGGNTINILWNNKTTNLHSIWDTQIPEKYAGGYNATYIQSYSDEIIGKLIKGGQYAPYKKSWYHCTDPKTPGKCALRWARDSNQYVCTFVLNPDPTGQELSTSYYDGAAPIVEQQIAKGGVRLAAYLNMIVTGHPGKI